jgi:type 1 fimbria pilin
MVNTSPLSSITGGLGGKYVESFAFTAATTSTITHNLGSEDVLVQLKDSTGELIIPNTVNNYTTNSVDINVSSTETMRVIIIG